MLYVNVNNAFASRIRPPITNSDHNVVYLIPRNKSKFKSSKPVVREIRDWSFEAKEKLKACFDLADWSLFYNPCSLDETAMVTNDHIHFCVQSVIPSKIINIYPNNKKFESKDMKNKIIIKKRAFENKDALSCKHLERELKNKLREAKVAHQHKMEETFRETKP